MGNKSVIASMAITTAGSSHNCRFNKRHRIVKGEPRLTITEEGRPLHYCLDCGKKFVEIGSGKLAELLAAIAGAAKPKV